MSLDAIIASLQSAKATADALPAPDISASLAGDISLAQSMLAPSLPAWVPAIGAIANVSLNVMHDVDPCPANNCSWSGGVTKQSSVFNDTGVAVIPWLGTMGSLAITAGGHNDYFGNEVYVYDIALQKWWRLTDPDPLTYGEALSGPDAGYFADHIHGEIFADASHTTTKQNAPSPSHLYCYLVAIPPGVAGMGAMGGLMSVARPALSPTGSYAGRQSHILDFAAQIAAGPGDPQWRRIGGLVPSAIPAYGGAILDTKRMVVWGTESTGTNGIPYRLDLNVATPQWAYVPSFPWGAFNCYYGTPMYAPEIDRILYFRNHQNGNSFAMIDPTAPTKVLHPTLTGEVPPAIDLSVTLGGGSDWCGKLAGGPGFVYYLGMGGFDAYVIQPTDSTLTTWQGRKVTLAGDTPPVQFSAKECTHMRRFVFADSIERFLWIAGNGAPVQAWGVELAAAA
jgi:hypothetical protein